MDRCRLVKKPDMASLLASHGVAEAFQRANQPVGRYPRAAASCRLDGNQFVLYKMQLDELRLGRRIFKVEACHFQHVLAQLLPGLGFREDCLAKRPRHIAALFCLAYLEDQFHARIITEISRPLVIYPLHLSGRGAGAVLLDIVI
jgi:hypothetical protein